MHERSKNLILSHDGWTSNLSHGGVVKPDVAPVSRSKHVQFGMLVDAQSSPSVVLKSWQPYMNSLESSGPNPTVSATIPDWSRESKPLFSWQPSRSLLASLRSYDKWSRITFPGAFLIRKITVLRHRFWTAITGAEINLGTRIGGGLLLPHPNGVVIHPQATIGPNCLIFQQVTLGVGERGAPKIGGHVDIGAGAKILGAVTIGDHAKIGANAVVLDDVPPFATAVGVPARLTGAQSAP